MELKKITDPYPHAIITEVVRRDVYTQLRFPELPKRNNTRAGWDLFKGEKRYDEFFTQDPRWKHAQQILDSEEFIFSICRAFRDELKLQEIDVDKLELIDFI
jgi:hypothetical protein